jgi:hypothetical protein
LDVRKARTDPGERGCRWLAVALLPLSLCLCSLSLSLAALSRYTELKPPAGWVARVCVEWGVNWRGHRQVGLWWEAARHEFASPSLAPNNPLRVACGDILWWPGLPVRRTFIHTW